MTQTEPHGFRAALQERGHGRTVAVNYMTFCSKQERFSSRRSQEPRGQDPTTGGSGIERVEKATGRTGRRLLATSDKRYLSRQNHLPWVDEIALLFLQLANDPKTVACGFSTLLSTFSTSLFRMVSQLFHGSVYCQIRNYCPPFEGPYRRGRDD
jgi:hypothetical protein